MKNENINQDSPNNNLNNEIQTKNNSFLICPNCITRVPLIVRINIENGEEIIEGKCDCGNFNEPLISYINKIENIKIEDNNQCISRSHPPKDADLFCYDCNRTLCTNCFTVHLDFFFVPLEYIILEICIDHNIDCGLYNK